MPKREDAGDFAWGDQDPPRAVEPMMMMIWMPYYFSFLIVQGVRLTTHLDLVLRVRMSGVVPPIPLYTSFVWTGTNFTFKTFVLTPPRFILHPSHQGWKNFPEIYLKILDARREIFIKLHTDDPKYLAPSHRIWSQRRPGAWDLCAPAFHFDTPVTSLLPTTTIATPTATTQVFHSLHKDISYISIWRHAPRWQYSSQYCCDCLKCHTK